MTSSPSVGSSRTVSCTSKLSVRQLFKTFINFHFVAKERIPHDTEEPKSEFPIPNNSCVKYARKVTYCLVLGLEYLLTLSDCNRVYWADPSVLSILKLELLPFKV